MQIKSPPMTRQHYEFIADIMGPQVSWPSNLQSIADALESTNPRFDRAKFIARATKAWEDNYNPEEISDEIRF
tara:strand:- start:569 stop:787 length:219 start_codon:yes stop_codon:yes gene_type:complete